MTPIRRKVPCLLLVLLTFGAVGCGNKNPVHGTIVFDDNTPAKELVGSVVLFVANDGSQSAMGYVDANGEFVLSTEGTDDGVVAGSYRVSVAQPDTSPVNSTPPNFERALEPNETPLDPAEIERRLEKYRKQQTIPQIIDPKFAQLETSGLTAEVKRGPNEITLRVRRPPVEAPPQE